jgi:2-iminobutanoate/2-iminopropanoate deaminase
MKRIIATSHAPKAIGPYSQAVEVNGMLFLSAQLGIDPETGKLEEGLESQTRRILSNITAVLNEAGYQISDVVKTTMYLSDISNFKTVNEIYAGVFGEQSPARAAMGGLHLPLGALIAIESIAVHA